MFSSVAQSVSCDFEEVFAGELTPEIKAFLIQQVLLQNPDGSAPSESFMEARKNAFNTYLKENVGDKDAQKTAAEKALVKAARDALKTCFTLMFYRSMSEPDLLSENDFLINYPTMKIVDAAELTSLTEFRNYLAASLRHLSAKNNKEKHLFIAGVLSVRKMVKYITGGGQSAFTAAQKRVSIYEREGKVTPKKKGKRSLADSDDSSVSSDLTEKSQSKRVRGPRSSSASASSASSDSTYAAEELELPADMNSIFDEDAIAFLEAHLIEESSSAETSVSASTLFVQEAAPAAVAIKEEKGSVVTCDSDCSALTDESDFLMDFDFGFDFSGPLL